MYVVSLNGTVKRPIRVDVKINVILDKSQRTEQYSSADFIAHADIKVQIDDKHKIAHNKIMIIDSKLYEWLKLPAFKTEVERQREQIIQESFGILAQGLTKAIETITGLLGDSDKRLKQLAAKDVIDYFIKHKELDELMKRIEAIEQKLSNG